MYAIQYFGTIKFTFHPTKKSDLKTRNRSRDFFDCLNSDEVLNHRANSESHLEPSKMPFHPIIDWPF